LGKVGVFFVISVLQSPPPVRVRIRVGKAVEVSFFFFCSTNSHLTFHLLGMLE